MYTLHRLATSAGLAVVLAVGGCASALPPSGTLYADTTHPVAAGTYSRGIVQSIDLVQIPTVAGASIVGPDAPQTADAFKFTILMEDRSYQTLIQTAHGDLRVGDRVQVGNGAVRRY